VLIVVEHGDFKPLDQLLFDIHAPRRGNIFQIDAAERRGQLDARPNQFVHVLRIETDGKRIDAAERLKEHALAFHNRHGGLRPMLPNPSTAEPSETTATVFLRMVSEKLAFGSS